MAFYEARGFGSLLYPYKGELEPFEYIATFKPLVVPSGADIVEYKRTKAPYCISGTVRAEKNGSYKRNNDSLINRDLIFLDYDDLPQGVDFPREVSRALQGYSYIIYPTIKHTAEKPRYRLVVKPSDVMTETTYKTAVQEIADKIGLPFDLACLTWSQLQGLPVTTGDPKEYMKIVERGSDYPVSDASQGGNSCPTSKHHAPSGNNKQSITMAIIDTLLNGFGDEGGCNMRMTQFVGRLLNRWVRCPVARAYELTQLANSITPNPLSDKELERTFESIFKAEIRKRGGEWR
ncbi:primase alpha helix C-terminal domain-containing protein [Streptococcus hyointestinalis]|nr:primase alpha helix C-terminal domain-containing protein [Streptococcus hyointestinalis]